MQCRCLGHDSDFLTSRRTLADRTEAATVFPKCFDGDVCVQVEFVDAYVASLQPLYAKLAQQPGALDKVTRRIARAEVGLHASTSLNSLVTDHPDRACVCDSYIPMGLRPRAPATD